MDTPAQGIPSRERVGYYLRLGLLGFAGPVARVGQMEREMVGQRRRPSRWTTHTTAARAPQMAAPMNVECGLTLHRPAPKNDPLVTTQSRVEEEAP